MEANESQHDIQQSKVNEQAAEYSTSTSTDLDTMPLQSIESEPNPFEVLELRQKAFVYHLSTNGFNKQKAAIMAGYSKDSAHVTASNLLSHPKIQDAINWLLESQGITPKKIEYMAWEIATEADIARFLNPNTGELELVDPDTGMLKAGTHLIRKINKDKDGAWTITMYSRLDALRELAKMAGMYPDNATGNNYTQNNNIVQLSPEQLSEVMSKVKQYEQLPQPADPAQDSENA